MTNHGVLIEELPSDYGRIVGLQAYLISSWTSYVIAFSFAPPPATSDNSS